MLIGNKEFPYPLLKNGSENSGYKNSSFYFDFKKDNEEPIIRNGMLVLEDLSFVLDNAELNDLYDRGLVKVICEVDCSNTVYREFFDISKETTTKEIPIANLANIVTVSAYLVANAAISEFYSEDFIDDYDGYKFNFKPASVLAADDGFKFRIDIDESNDDKVASIFTFVKKDEADDLVTYLNDSNKISIYLSPMIFDIYDISKNHSMYNNIFFSNLVIPVLTSCLMEIQKDYADCDSIEDICDDKNWFKSIRKRYAYVKGVPLEAEDFFNANAFELAQLLMNKPTSKSIDDFYHIAIDEEESEDE